jgi:hypothetical protein
MWQWRTPRSGNSWTLGNRALPGRWVEYRPKLMVFDAICEGVGWSVVQRMAGARILRTDDLFAAIGFLLRDGRPSPKGETK